MTDAPWMWIIGGADGAGKSTLAASLFPELMAQEAYVDADAALYWAADADDPTRATKVLAARLYARIAAGLPFVVEHPLNDGLMLEAIHDWHAQGGQVGLVWLWLGSATTAIARVAERAARASDDAGASPNDAAVKRRLVEVRRRLHDYLDAVDGWLILDNSGDAPVRVAEGAPGRVRKFDPVRYHVVVGGRRDRATSKPVFAGDWSAEAERRARRAIERRRTLERFLNAAG